MTLFQLFYCCVVFVSYTRQNVKKMFPTEKHVVFFRHLPRSNGTMPSSLGAQRAYHVKGVGDSGCHVQHVFIEKHLLKACSLNFIF